MPRFLLWVFLMFSLFFGAECRIGEAKKPGPSEAMPEVDPDNTWTLGICNPSGLLGKGTLVSGINAEVLAVSETHLTAPARTMLQNSLRSFSDYRHVVTGAPLAARSNASVAGHYSGVATISKVPCRALPAHWPEDMFSTGRVMVSGSLVCNTWITGAVLYGYPQGKTHLQAFEKTVACLDAMFTHMTQSAVGPRYMCGDWNFEHHQLEVCDKLQALGWREAQDLHFAATGNPPQLTCKRSTRKDFLWLSPELVYMFRTLEVDDTRFPDHAVLTATFHTSKAAVTRYLWPYAYGSGLA